MKPIVFSCKEPCNGDQLNGQIEEDFLTMLRAGEHSSGTGAMVLGTVLVSVVAYSSHSAGVVHL